jgi:hypothetical protein
MMNDPVAQLKSKQSLGKLDSNPTGFWLFFHTFSLKSLDLAPLNLRFLPQIVKK